MGRTEKSNGYSHIIKYMGVFGGVQTIGILIGLLRNKLIALILGPNGLGLLSLFNSAIKLVADATNLGISASAVKSISENFESGNEKNIIRSVAIVRFWSLLTALLGTVVCIILSPLLNKWTFTWGDHTLHFVFLSPAVGLMAVTGGELAILKATRQLRSLAIASVYNFAAALFFSVPVVCFFGEKGIVPSIVILSLCQMLMTIIFSFKRYPLKLSFDISIFKGGVGLVKLGVAFVAAMVMGSLSEFIIRSYLNNNGSLGTVGLYNAGYVMTMVYGGMVFSAMETDYFPRLSAITLNGDRFNDTINKQIEVSLLLISPMLAAFLIFLPIIIPILYSSEFLPVIGMMQALVPALYMRAIKLPLSYVPLARGDSFLFMILEGVYAVFIVTSVIWFYDKWGLSGTGFAILLTAVVDFLMLSMVMHHKYGFVFSRSTMKCSIIHLSVGVMAFAVTFINYSEPVYWIVGIFVIILSLVISLIVLHSKTSLWNSLKSKFCKR